MCAVMIIPRAFRASRFGKPLACAGDMAATGRLPAPSNSKFPVLTRGQTGASELRSADVLTGSKTRRRAHVHLRTTQILDSHGPIHRLLRNRHHLHLLNFPLSEQSP